MTTDVLERGFFTVLRINPHAYMASVIDDAGVLPRTGLGNQALAAGSIGCFFPQLY